MKADSKSKVLSGVIVAAAIAGSSNAQTPPAPSSGANKVQFTTGRIFNSFGDGSEHMQKMRERLQDPQQRAALREEHRGYIVAANYDVAEVLELDAATSNKLIELLTDQQMAQLEEFHLRGPSQGASPDLANHLQVHADRQNREIDALRELLGQEKLERYQAYRATSGERWQVREFETHLASADKLSPKQKEQMIELFRVHNQRLFQGHSFLARRTHLSRALLRDTPQSQEELERSSQLMNIESNEDSWRRMPVSDRQLREQAAAFLTAAQLSTLEQMHAEKAQQLKLYIEQMRVQAGLNPTIPDAAASNDPTPAKVTRDVRVRIKIAVNQAKAATFTEVVKSGTPYTFEVDEGLLVQATPNVYDNDTYDLSVEYFEQGPSGKRPIGRMGGIGTLSQVPPVDDALGVMGGSSTVITGSKAYAIELSTSVEGT